MSLLRQSLRLTRRIIIQKATEPLIISSRSIKRWVAPTIREIVKRREKVGPEPERPRSTYLEWNEDVEMHCLAKRLGEKFDKSALKEAFVQQEWANIQEFKAKESGDESFEVPQHNHDLAEDGHNIILKNIQEVYSKSYPPEVVTAIINYLTSDDMLAHIAKHLGLKDLIKSVEYPPETKTLADTFRAIVGALALSNDESRVKLFINDFVVCQMNGKDIYDIWTPEKPFDYMLKLLEERGVSEVEPRLCNQSATNTILANYQVGLYNSKDKSCLGLGWGENLQIAKDTAALDVIQRIYSGYPSK